MLQEWGGGDRDAFNRLIVAVYSELHRVVSGNSEASTPDTLFRSRLSGTRRISSFASRLELIGKIEATSSLLRLVRCDKSWWTTRDGVRVRGGTRAPRSMAIQSRRRMASPASTWWPLTARLISWHPWTCVRPASS